MQSSSSNNPPPGLRISPYNQVINAVSIQCPNLTRAQIDMAMIALRRIHGDLRGFTVSSLAETLIERFAKVQAYGAKNGKMHETSQPTSRINKESSITQDVPNCSICLTPICMEMSSNPVEILDCLHQFHAKCIKRWLDENKSCPECRTYSLPQEEYPNLA